MERVRKSIAALRGDLTRRQHERALWSRKAYFRGSSPGKLTNERDELEHDNPPLPRVPHGTGVSAHNSLRAGDVLKGRDTCGRPNYTSRSSTQGDISHYLCFSSLSGTTSQIASIQRWHSSSVPHQADVSFTPVVMGGVHQILVIITSNPANELNQGPIASCTKQVLLLQAAPGKHPYSDADLMIFKFDYRRRARPYLSATPPTILLRGRRLARKQQCGHWRFL